MNFGSKLTMGKLREPFQRDTDSKHYQVVFMKKLTVLVDVRNEPRNAEKRRVFLMISMETRESQVTFQNNASCSEENSRIIYMQLLCVAFLQNQTKVHSFVYLMILSMVRNGVVLKF